MPGGYYRSNANQKLKPLKIDLQPEILAAWKEAAARSGMSQRQAAIHLILAFAREHGVDVPAHPGPNDQSHRRSTARRSPKHDRERNAQSAAPGPAVQ
jgi:hypothetical protein